MEDNRTTSLPFYDPETLEKLVSENADYVLGMIDLYPTNQEIINILRKRGLPLEVTNMVISRIRIPAYEKRIRQHKRRFLVTSLTFLILVLIGYSLSQLPEAGTLLTSKRKSEAYLRSVLRDYMVTYFVLLLLFFLVAVKNLWKYYKFRKLLASETAKSNQKAST